MHVSNTADCTGGTDEAYATSKVWTLNQTNGTATVYVKYGDAAGNWSACINDTITHDNSVPTVSVTNTGWVNASNYTSYTVTGACSENGQAVTIGGSASGSGTCNGTSYTAAVNYTSVGDGAAAVSITADMDDAAGNSAAQATANLGKDIVAPAIAITSSAVITSANESAYSVTGTCTDTTSGTTSQTVSIGGSVSTSGNCSGGAFTIATDYSGQSDVVVYR